MSNLIYVSGSARRSFSFPASRPVAFEFYSSLARIVPFLPRIHLVASAGDEIYRVAYRSVELGTYKVDIPCDLQVKLDYSQYVLHASPCNIDLFPAVNIQSGFTSTSGKGEFTIISRFYENTATQTNIDYTLTLSSHLPRPTGLSIVPGAVMDGIVQRIVQMRITEIVDHFISASISAFDKWQPPDKVPARK